MVVKSERPQTVTKVQSFLGLAGYYRRFVEGFSKMVSPLTHLTRKDQPSHGQMSVRPILKI